MTRSTVTRPLALITFTLGMLLARPNLGPTPAVAASLVPGATAASVEPETPNTNPYSDPSQCVYLAWELAAEHGHKLPNFGDAADWRQGAIDYGLTVNDNLTPEAVDGIAVWGPGVGGAGWAGHVGWVSEVKGGRFHVQERNWTGGDSDRWVQWEEGMCFITFPKPAPAKPAVAAAAPTPAAVKGIQALLRGEDVPRRPTLQDLQQDRNLELRNDLLREAGIGYRPDILRLLRPWL